MQYCVQICVISVTDGYVGPVQVSEYHKAHGFDDQYLSKWVTLIYLINKKIPVVNPIDQLSMIGLLRLQRTTSIRQS